jgi:hypothetical protein
VQLPILDPAAVVSPSADAREIFADPIDVRGLGEPYLPCISLSADLHAQDGRTSPSSVVSHPWLSPLIPLSISLASRYHKVVGLREQ